LEASDDASPTWNSTVNSVARASFTNYDEARYFFNSGGKLTIDLDSVDGDWDDIFTTTGQIIISALNIVNIADNDYTFPGGFYGITPDGEYKELYTVTGYVTAGDYYGSAYSNRSIKISLRGEETVVGGEFNVYIKVTLIDDETSGIINSQLNADYGYISQNTTPTQEYIDAGSNGAFFTVDTQVYKFIQTQIPVLSICTSWTTIVPDMNTVCVEPTPLAYIIPGYTVSGYTE